MPRTTRRRRRDTGTIQQLPWQPVINPYPPAEPLSADRVEAIHDASLAILERMGIRVLHQGARELFAGASAEVDHGEQNRLPYRSSNTTSANTVDAQADYESEMFLWGAVTAHASVLNQGAGWLQGGLTASFEKLIVDAEMLQMMVEYLKPMAVDEQTLGLATIAEVDPGGHFFGTQHTLDRYEDAFYTPLVSDWSNHETWQESGARTTAERANTIWKQLLREYQQPELDAGIDEALADYVARRKRAISSRI